MTNSKSLASSASLMIEQVPILSEKLEKASMQIKIKHGLTRIEKN